MEILIAVLVVLAFICSPSLRCLMFWFVEGVIWLNIKLLVRLFVPDPPQRQLLQPQLQPQLQSQPEPDLVVDYYRREPEIITNEELDARFKQWRNKSR